ncbi:MAG: hypothetical protein PWR13_1142 [Archaeoglobi archaeon]|nr:hypothetical protein [Archaeoglobi archaeon]
MIIGVVRGIGENPNEFEFITPDVSKMSIGDFVTLEHDGMEIISRINECRPLTDYPPVMYSNPEIPPSRIAEILGDEEKELYVVRATILGYFDEESGEFVNPRIIPRQGSQVKYASEELLKKCLNRKTSGRGIAHIGYMLTRRDVRVPIYLDVSAIASEHMCILASTGSGKSYLAGVIVEELLSPRNMASVLIFDPHGEYHTLVEMMNREEFREGWYSPEVEVIPSERIKIRFSELEVSDISASLPEMSERMETLLRRAYEMISSEPIITRALLKRAIVEIAEEDESMRNTARALLWRIDRVFDQSRIFDDFEHLSLQRLFSPGKCTILDLSSMGDWEQQMVALIILRKLLHARMMTERGNASGESYLPYPVFIILEEAHRFAPRGGDSRALPIIRRILSEGRKFGIGVCLISQRPSKIDGDVLSQCMTSVIMRIVNPSDQESIRISVESVGREVLKELPGLTKGQAIVSGRAVNTTVLIKVRERLTPHGGESKNAPEEWRRYLESKRGREILLLEDEEIEVLRT